MSKVDTSKTRRPQFIVIDEYGDCVCVADKESEIIDWINEDSGGSLFDNDPFVGYKVYRVGSLVDIKVETKLLIQDKSDEG